MSARPATHLHTNRPVTRAERRAAERAAEKAKGKHTSATPNWALFVGILIIVAAIAAFGSAALLGGSGGSHAVASAPAAKAVTDPAALDPAADVLKVGTQAPDFSLQDAMGVNYSLSAERGHPVLLEFFAVWCPVCQRETSVIHKLTQRFEAKGVRTLAVLANPYGKNFEISQRKDLSLASANDLSWYAKQFKANYPLLVDPQFKTVNKYGISAYPGLYVIGKDGKILSSGTGYEDYNSLALKLNKALK